MWFMEEAENAQRYKNNNDNLQQHISHSKLSEFWEACDFE